VIEYIVIGAISGGLVAVAIVLSLRRAQRNAAKRTARAEYAHSEPGGPHAHRHGGASGDASARLAEGGREWAGS